MKKTYSYPFLILLMTVGISCSSQKAPFLNPEGEQLQPAAAEDIFYMADHTGKINLDPVYAYTSQDAQLFTAFSEGLVSYHPFYLTPMPGVARSWDISPDRKTYTFQLRSDALYNNGDPVQASDFKKAWLRLLEPEKKAEYSLYFDIIKGAREYRLGELKDPEKVGIRVFSEHTLEVELERPVSHFLKLLCHMSFAPVHPSYISKDDWNHSRSLISNGPYNFFKTSDTEIILNRNNLYWNSRYVAIPQINILLSDNTKEITKLFNAGQLHWATHFETESLGNNTYIHYFPSFSLKFYFFRSQIPPWNDPRVRRGLCLLLPWQELRSDSPLFEADSIIPEIPGYTKQEGLKQNREEGLQLLRDAGFPAGEGLPPLIVKIAANSLDLEVGAKMKTIWGKELNLEVQLIEIGFENYFEELKKEDYTLGTMVWIGDYADPLSMLQLWVSESNLNEAHYSNPDFDELIYVATGESDQEERSRLLGEAEKILLKTAVILPLRQQPSFNLVNNDLITGWFPNILDIHPFMYMQFETNSLIPGVVAAPKMKRYGLNTVLFFPDEADVHPLR